MVAVPTAEPVAPSRRPGTAGAPAPTALARFAARAAGARGGGVLLYLSFPPRTLWWLALPAFALLGLVLHGRGPRAGFGWGFLFGLGFLLPLLVWTGSFVGAAAVGGAVRGRGGVRRAGRRRDGAGRAGCPRRRCWARRCGSRARRCAAGCRSAACRGAGSGSASRTARCCRWPRSAASRCCRS